MTMVFTPEQANRILPKVRATVLRIRELREKIGASRGQERNELMDEFGVLISRLEEMGVELKDINSGLVDFPAQRFGEPVYLCWKLGEREVMYWHGLSEGYRGRKLLKPEVAQIR